jgi:ABC-2 type transport system ATP-binding protein
VAVAEHGPARIRPRRRPAAVEVRGLTKNYGAKEVLRGVDLFVNEGEVLALLGSNGAGKTTTVEILAGFRRRSGGSVHVLGIDPAGQPIELRRRIGIVLQECGFPREFTVAELIDIQRSYYPKSRSRDELLDVADLATARDVQVARLSGGQRRRLDLALALAGDPSLIFLDEPTTGYDLEAREATWRTIRRLAGLGKTVLLTTHHLDEAETLADRIAILVDGRIAAADTAARLIRRYCPTTVITFHLSRSSLRPLPDFPGGTVRMTKQRNARIETTDVVDTLGRLMSWTRRYRVGIDRLQIKPPGLTDVYRVIVPTHRGEAE